jgi:hypothetical protein
VTVSWYAETVKLVAGTHRKRGKRIAAAFQTPCEAGAGANPRVNRSHRGEHQRVRRDGRQRCGDNEALRLRRQQPERYAKGSQDEGELANLREARADGERSVKGVRNARTSAIATYRISHHHEPGHSEQFRRLFDNYRRIEEHSDRDEEKHGKGVAQRQRFLGGSMTQF